IMFPIDMLPEVLQNIGKVLPATYAVEILISLGDISSKMVIPLLGLGAIGLVTLAIVYRKIQID
ncbi:MAG: hypothetical protein ACRC68_16950, partial [Clostridium sp.]